MPRRLPAPLVDARARPLRTLRLSVTDRCNLRCAYCMPEESYAWLPREDLLSVAELDRLAGGFVRAGVEKVRITGGEPLLRRDLPALVRLLAKRAALQEIALTTNGVLLAERAAELKDAGLGRVTVSIDTLRPETFQRLTRRTTHAQVIAGIEAARRAGFAGLKLDTVVMRGVNDDELPELVRFARAVGAEIRFIEYMDVGGATRWSASGVVSRAEMLARLEAQFGPVSRAFSEPSAPAERFVMADGTVFGIIASVTEPFCAACDRARVSADGRWFRCLYETGGIDLREPLRSGASDEALLSLLENGWRTRDARGAELRAGMPDRTALIPVDALRRDPHREMHKRGG